MTEALFSLEKFNALENRRLEKETMQQETARTVGQLNEQTSRLQVELAEKEREVDQLRLAIPQLEQKASDGEVHRREARQLKEQTSQLQVELAEKEREVDQLRVSVPQLEQKASATAMEWDRKVQGLQVEVGQLKAQVGQLQTACAEKDTEIDQLKELLKQGAKALRNTLPQARPPI